MQHILFYEPKPFHIEDSKIKDWSWLSKIDESKNFKTKGIKINTKIREWRIYDFFFHPQKNYESIL